MRLAEYTAPDGTKHLAWLRNADADEDAQALGVPHDPPDVGSLGLDAETARALHNALVERRLVVWQSARHMQRTLSEVGTQVGLDASQRRKLAALYEDRRDPGHYLHFDLDAALNGIDPGKRVCIKRTFLQAGIRTLKDVENAPTRVGHICGLDIYQIVARIVQRAKAQSGQEVIK
jgi:hypothetical protein